MRPKRFEHLPFGVFRHCTNIYGLVNEKLSQKYHKCPPNFVIKKTIEKYYEKLQNADKWDDEIIEQLEYKCGPGVEMMYVITLNLNIFICPCNEINYIFCGLSQNLQ